MKQLMHVYKCDDCNLIFAVDQAFEDQSEVVCPVCQSDENMKDIKAAELREL